jgi:myo-inositol 2-dehydrogenase / D-chiro-inositol 1-dehydrogenase
MVRYGIIGSGMMGQEHIRNILLLEGAEVSAVADPNDQMRAAAVVAAGGRARAFADYREMLSADLCDAYVVASPNDAHHAQMLELMPGNKPILVEKPLCTTSDACREVIASVNGRTAPVWVAMEYRYMPPVERLRKELARGRAGTPRMIAIREHRFPFLEKVAHWNRFAERTGGTLVEKCCHFWDLMRLLAGADPVRVYASGAMDVNFVGETFGGRPADILDNAFVVVDFANGIRGMLDLCMFAEGSHWQEVVSVTGDAARIDACVPGPARFAPGGVERHSEVHISDRKTKRVSRARIQVDEAILKAGDHHGSTYFQHRKFFDLVRTGQGRPEVTLDDGLWSVRVGEAAELSARTGQAITLETA